MIAILSYLAARLGESSTYASVAGLLVLLGMHVPAGEVHNAAALGALIAGALGIIIAERGKPAPQIAADVLANLAARVTPPNSATPPGAPK